MKARWKRDRAEGAEGAVRVQTIKRKTRARSGVCGVSPLTLAMILIVAGVLAMHLLTTYLARRRLSTQSSVAALGRRRSLHDFGQPVPPPPPRQQQRPLSSVLASLSQNSQNQQAEGGRQAGARASAPPPSTAIPFAAKSYTLANTHMSLRVDTARVTAFNPDPTASTPLRGATLRYGVLVNSRSTLPVQDVGTLQPEPELFRFVAHAEDRDMREEVAPTRRPPRPPPAASPRRPPRGNAPPTTSNPADGRQSTQ